MQRCNYEGNVNVVQNWIMANDVIVQIRIESQPNSEVERLFRHMGTTFSEVVCLFTRQCLIKRKLPLGASNIEDPFHSVEHDKENR